VILIITDDQGYGDLGINGNHHIRTPVIDKLATESIVFQNFYVTPVCATTRSGLMTGRYNLRTGIRDTYNGGAIMATSEITIAELLKEADYSTGIFGKWHLGDNYPSRPMDQGFDESVIHLSGGMGQVGDITTYFKRDSSYFDPVLWHNGQQKAYRGYCSDIFTKEAIRFIEENKNNPFFCYLSFNAPHTPLQVPDEYYQKYKDIDPASGFDQVLPFPDMSEKDKEDARKVYAMVENIDDNLGKLFRRVDQLGIANKTVIIFMTDNGPQQKRYIAGMKGRKSDVYRGGVRVPFYFKYPKLNNTPNSVSTSAANIDVLPTLAELCGLSLPTDRKIDGQSLVPLMKNEAVDWGDRSLFFYWTRRYPELYSNMAIQKGAYKLVGNCDFDASITDFELYHMEDDPYELQNLVHNNEALASELKQEMDRYYHELINSRNIQIPPKVRVGTKYENPVILNRNDAGGSRGIWSQEEIYGTWDVQIEEGTYNISFKFLNPVGGSGRMLLELDSKIYKQEYRGSGADMIVMENLYLKEFIGELIPTFVEKGKRILPFWVELERVDL